MKRLLMMVAGLVIVVSAQAASFDCAKAETKVEYLICDNPKISELDSKLGQVYMEVLGKANEEQKQRVIVEQKHWLKFTRNVCGSHTCLKHAYWSRQAALVAYYEPHSTLYKKESEMAVAIKQVLATASLKYSAGTDASINQFCSQIFDDLKQMKGITFVDPVVQVQSYEDPALDSWKQQCQSAPPFNFTYQCERNIEPADADDVVDACRAGYGLPPYKLYELPVDGSPDLKRHIFYTDDAYGPMNFDFQKPRLGGGFAGFQQIDTAKCMSVLGNKWQRGSKKAIFVDSVFADAGQGDRNGKNYNSIFEYKKQYYFLVLHQKSYGGHSLLIASVLPNGTKGQKDCNWFPQ